MAQGGWTYIMTNKPHGVLYIGVTGHLAAASTSIAPIRALRFADAMV